MGIDSALALIESVKDYSVLFIGDAIVDEYVYVESLGKSPKEHLIPMRYVSEEVFLGGVFAAANHARSFCRSVDVWTGKDTTRKVRMVDKTYLRKLAEVHYTEERCQVRSGDSLVHDLVVIADFGHGAIGAKEADHYAKAPFVAINAQTNSANIGFNLITKYAHADYIVIDEPEARLAAADKDGHIEDVIQKLAWGRCDRFVVTHGTKGAYGYDHGKFYHQEAFTDKVVDTLGAGDAFFSVTAPMSKTGSMEDLLLVGCIAGAIQCGIVGNRSSVTKEEVKKWLEKLPSH